MSPAAAVRIRILMRLHRSGIFRSYSPAASLVSETHFPDMFFLPIPIHLRTKRVKLGVHEETGEQVAVKIMDKSDIKAQEMTLNVRREIAIMKALKHRNIVNLRQVLTSNTKLYIVMDLVTGGELFTKILKGKLEERIARRYFQQLVDGIEYCHRRGVCHRDLKPENLLIDETTGELKITDFGLSAMKGASTTEELLHTQCGSPNYCAPEIIARHKEGYNGTKVDAWSCGIILFALLTGFLPFYDENTKTLYHMIQRDEVRFPKKFPHEARDLVLHLLHKDPDKRFTLAHVKQHSWFVIDYEGDDALPRSIGSSASPPASRRRRRHARKSSVDQAPRSREFPNRKKSERSEHDSAFYHGTDHAPPPAAPAPPEVHPVPPPVIDSTPRIVPPHSRRPAPPPTVPNSKPPISSRVPPPPPPPPPPSMVQRPPPSSGVPPPPPPPAMQMAAPPQVHMEAPLPPPIPAQGTTLPPTMYPKVGSGSINNAPRPVPPYPGSGVPRRKSRESRESPQNDIASVSSMDSSNAASVGNSGTRSSAVPSYSSLSEPTPAPQPQTPPSQVSRSAPGVVPDRADRPVCFPGVDSINAEGKTSTSPTSNPSKSPVNRATQSAPEEARSAGDGPEVPSPQDQVSPQKAAKKKWAVVGSTPTSSYQSKAAPVTTPSLLADGDASWVRSREPRPHAIAKAKPETVPASNGEMSEVPEASPAPREDISVVEEPKEPEQQSAKPLSIVEQQRLKFNSLANQSTMPPPLPDTSFRSSSARLESPAVDSDSTVTKAQRFQDRVEQPVMQGYPTGLGVGDQAADGSAGLELITDVSGLEAVPESYTDTPAEADGAFVERNVDRNENGGTTFPPQDIAEPVVQEDVQMQRGHLLVVSDDQMEAPLKERLAAAVARYRRIFKLGNKIGITSSPSFSSNKGMNAPGDSSGDDESKRPSSGRSDFFARAKAITGAWGIILTQEVEEDSDSDDDGPQVTEAELQSFSKLLDFWDNRRASASVPHSGEVILDDEDSSPLTEGDILSIQSLLQKLEPKQVEEHMTEVVEVGVEPAEMQRKVSPENPDSLDDLEVEDIHIVPIDALTEDASARDAASHLPHVSPSAGDTRPQNGLSSHAQHRSSPLPSPPPFPQVNYGSVNPPTPASPPLAARPYHRKTGSRDRAFVSSTPHSGALPPIPPPPAVNMQTQAESPAYRTPPPPPPMPPYAKPTGSPANHENRRLPVTASTVRDPYRPRGPPAYPPPKSQGSGSGSSLVEQDDSASKDRVDVPGVKQRYGRGTDRQSNETEGVSSKRKSSTTASEDAAARKTMSRDSGRMMSGASGASEGSMSGMAPKRGHHARTSSRDEHAATRGLFAFGMFNRRKSSSMTSFDSDLPPERCLLELGRILTMMRCNVLMKKSESKMKCEAPIRNEKVAISVTCTREKSMTSVHFRRGKKDRSHVDAKEFYDFFQVVHGRFLEQVRSETQRLQ